MITAFLTAASIGYDLRSCDQGVTFSKDVSHVKYDTPEGVATATGSIPEILAILHAAGYSAAFSEGIFPGVFIKHVAARALPEKTWHQFHVKIDIAGALANRSFRGYTGADGKALCPKDVEAGFRQALARGEKFILCADPAECPEFSRVTGCPGHTTTEP